MTRSTLVSRGSWLLALLVAAGCGVDGPTSTVIDKATVWAGEDPVVVTLAAKRARTEFELPASATRQSVALQLEQNVPGAGEVRPVGGLALHVTTAGLTFDPQATMRQAVSPPASHQHYVAVSMPSAGGTWVVGPAARPGTFHDPLQPAASPAGTEVWEIDVAGSGLWALGLVRQSRLDAGVQDADDRGAVREVGAPLVVDGGIPTGQLDGAIPRWDGGSRETFAEATAIDAGEDTSPDAVEFVPDVRTRVDVPDVPIGPEPDARVPSGDAPVSPSDAPVVQGDAPVPSSDAVYVASAAEVGLFPSTDMGIEAPVAPRLTASPTSLGFGDVVTGTASAATSISIHNGGSSSTGVLSLALAGADAGAFSFTSNCASGLPVGATCVIVVTFSPKAPGSSDATLTVTDGSTACSVPLSGIGVATLPALTASPGAFDFGTLLVNTTSAPASITVRNGGAAATGTLVFTITGAAASSFVRSSACPSSLAAGAACVVTVTFKPVDTGSATGTLIIGDGNLTATVALSGTGAGASALDLEVSPESLDFGSVATGTTSAATSISVRNSGTATTSMLALTLTGSSASSFAFTSGCSSPLAPGETCTATVTFSPSAVGGAAAILSITDGNAIATVSLAGVGIDATPRLTLSPSAADFGVAVIGKTSAPAVFSITNSGSVALGSLVFTITGASASSFAATPACSSPLAPGGMCTVAVTFSPAVAGSATASLTVASGAATASAALSGVGIASARLAASPASVDFGVTTVGSTSGPTGITVTNSGGVATGSLTVSRTGSAPSPFVFTTTCSGALLSGESCVVATTFAPTSAGALSAAITVGDGSASVSVPLIGTAVGGAQLVATPARVFFGSVAVGSLSPATTITIGNAGGAPTEVLSISLSDEQFVVGANTCTGVSLFPASSCTVAVWVAPRTAGEVSGVLTVSAGTSTVAASLRAIGLAAPQP